MKYRVYISCTPKRTPGIYTLTNMEKGTLYTLTNNRKNLVSYVTLIYPKLMHGWDSILDSNQNILWVPFFGFGV